MTLVQEYQLQSLLAECAALAARQQKQAQSTLFARIDKIHEMLTANVLETFANYSQDVIIKFAELTVQVIIKLKQTPDKINYAHQIIRLYFQRIKDPSQFYIRALLVKAKLVAIKGHHEKKKAEEMIQVLKESIGFITKALDLIAGPQQQSGKGAKDNKNDPNAVSNKQKYAFLIFNASNCLYRVIRFMLRASWHKNFTDIVQRICKLFDEIDEPDHNWRCRFSLMLFQCLYDADKKTQAYKVLDSLWDKTKNKPCEFQQNLFRLRVHISKQNKALEGVIKKDTEGKDENGYRSLEILQKIKSAIIPENLLEKELTSLINTLAPAIMLENNQTSVGSLGPVIQERIAEAGRVALQFNFVEIADKICKYLNRVRQPTQKTMVLNEYNKAELLIKKEQEKIDPKTQMKYNSVELKMQQIENRSKALKVLEKVMLINKRLNDADLIYQGSILIWNLSLPFMTPSHREFVTKAFQISSLLLEQIQSTDHSLRSKMHLQLAKSYFSNEALFSRVQEHILKALSLDYSTPLNKLINKFDPQQDVSLYQRPHERYLILLKEKAELKKNNFDRSMTELDRVVIDLWNVQGQKSENTRIDILQKCLGNIVSIEEKEYDYESAQKKFLVEEQIKLEFVKHKQNNLKQLKKKKLLAAEIAEMAFEWEINEVAEKACEFVIIDKWQVSNANQMILAQVKCYYFLAQIQIDFMIFDNLEVAFTNPEVIEVDQDEQKVVLSEQQKEQILTRKRKIVNLLSKGLALADTIQQSWLIFNGAIYIWNNFLHIFKNPTNDSKLLPEIAVLLKQYFESMKKNLVEIEKKQIVCYDIDTKIQIYTNIGLIYARLMENAKQPDTVGKVCEDMLSNKQLSQHTRKLINSIKARNGKGPSTAQKPTDNKGGKNVPVQNSISNNSDQILSQIVYLLQVIKNSTNKTDTESQIIKCFELLQNWKAKQNDETQLELHAELWAKLGRLALKALNNGLTNMYKISLRSVEFSLSLMKPEVDIQSIPPNRLRWYSLAEYVYSENLAKIVSPQTQEPQNCQKMLFCALSHAVEAANMGYRCSITSLVLDASKQVWNISSRLQDSAKNRKELIKPIYSTLTYLKEIKEKNETDLLLLLSQLFFKCCIENQQYKIGESAADMLFELIPKSFQKPLWEAKMIFMSKQNKNQLQAISNMKEADVSLQAKLYVKLARVSTNYQKQFASYNKAIQILKKQNSVEIVEVLIQYAEWQLRTGKEKVIGVMGNLLLASDYLIDIEFGQEGENDAMDEDKATVFSRSTRGKKSQHSNSVSQKSKHSKQKKGIEKKSQMSVSNKSKGSRMNRTAQVTKTLKSKNTKSIFAQREEQSNPESLNCAHFERLFRIHIILSQISNNTEDRIRYAFDAKQFLIKILEISFKTLNTMDENASKYANIVEQKKNQQEFVKKYKMPESFEDWIKLSLNKQFLEKVKNYEDYNFMGVYLFEKAELTFTYISNLINLLESYSYHLQSIPIYFFLRFMAKQILNNPLLSNLCDLRYVHALKKCGFSKQYYQQILSSTNISKFKISEQEKKAFLSKTTSLRSNIEQQNNQTLSISSQSVQPNLIKPFSERVYQIWLQTAIQMVPFSEIPKAKELLKEALKHAKVLNDVYNMGRCHLELANIAYLEGELSQAANYIIITNKMCKNVVLWEKVYKMTFKILNKLKKFEDIKSFSSSIKDVINKLIKQAEQPKTEVPTHQQEILQLRQLLNTINLHSIKYYLKILREQPSLQKLKKLLEELNLLESSITSETKTLLASQYQFYTRVGLKLIQCLEENDFGKIGKHHHQLLLQISHKNLKILSKMEQQIMQALRYSSIGVDNSVFFHKNSFMIIHHELRLVLARNYVQQGILKRIIRYSGKQEQQGDEVHDLEDFQPLKKYMATLTIQINKALTQVPKRLESFETALNILTSIETKISKDSYLYIIWGVQYATAQRRLAWGRGKLESVWDQSKLQQVNHEATQSLAMSEKFKNEFQDRIDNLLSNSLAFNYAKRFFEEMIQNTGVLLPERSLEYLIKSQHYSYSEIMKKQIKQGMQKTSKFVTYPKLLKYLNYSNISELQTAINSNRLFDSLTKFPNYAQCLKLLPNNHMLIILQLSNDHSELYVSTYVNTKFEKQLIKIRKLSLTDKQQNQYEALKKQITLIKSNLTKIPIDEHDINKYYDLLAEMEVKLANVISRFEVLCAAWSQDIKTFLQYKKSEPEKVLDPKDIKKGAKEPPKGAKKGGKDELSSYESTLTASPSGVESITLLLDSHLYSLPFEQLEHFNSVPAISRDLSLFYLCRKLKQLSYKPELNNSIGWQSDKCKYVGYDYKKEQVNIENLINDISKQNAGVFKFQGVNSAKRIPSLGEYQRLMNSGTLLHVYGMPSFTNLFSLKNIFNTIELNKVKLAIITDNLNYKKSYLNKFERIEQGQIIKMEKQELRLINALNLLNISVVKNRWSPKLQSSISMFKKLYKNLAEDIYIGAAVKRLDGVEHKLLERFMLFYNGPPIIRI